MAKDLLSKYFGIKSQCQLLHTFFITSTQLRPHCKNYRVFQLSQAKIRYFVEKSQHFSLDKPYILVLSKTEAFILKTCTGSVDHTKAGGLETERKS